MRSKTWGYSWRTSTITGAFHLFSDSDDVSVCGEGTRRNSEPGPTTRPRKPCVGCGGADFALRANGLSHVWATKQIQGELKP